MWVSSHSGIIGNEIAHQLAKSATQLPLSKSTDLEFSYSVIKLLITQHCNSLWKNYYESLSTGTFYKEFFPNVAMKMYIIQWQCFDCKRDTVDITIMFFVSIYIKLVYARDQ